MWLTNESPGLLTDYYELTMAQVCWRRKMTADASFEVTIRRRPDDWGFFVMAGLAELDDFLGRWRFTDSDIDYLRTLGSLDDEFLSFLASLRPELRIRAMPEGTVFFAGEPVLEVTGPIVTAQLLETAILNILGFSILATTLASRCRLAAGPAVVADFGLRRCQSPDAGCRTARAAQIAGLPLTSNVLAARLLGMTATGTMAHSFIQIYESEQQAFHDFAAEHRENTILLVDTYDCVRGIETAARVAKQMLDDRGVRIKGIRLDSGDLLELSKLARKRFDEQGLGFMQIFASGDLDEFKIADLRDAGAPIDGFGIGTQFAVCAHAPAAEIVYKISTYQGRGLAKLAPGKVTLPGRKKVTRLGDEVFEKDIVAPLETEGDDLLEPFEAAEATETIRKRLDTQLSRLPSPVCRIRRPACYPVQFEGFDT